MCNHHLPGMVAALVEAERRTRRDPAYRNGAETGFPEKESETGHEETVTSCHPAATVAKA